MPSVNILSNCSVTLILICLPSEHLYYEIDICVLIFFQNTFGKVLHSRTPYKDGPCCRVIWNMIIRKNLYSILYSCFWLIARNASFLLKIYPTSLVAAINRSLKILPIWAKLNLLIPPMISYRICVIIWISSNMPLCAAFIGSRWLWSSWLALV